MRLTISQMQRAVFVLERLATRKKTTLIDNKAVTVDHMPKFADAQVWIALSDNEVEIRDALAAIGKQERALMQEFLGKGIDPTDPKIPNGAWIVAQGALQDDGADVEITLIDEAAMRFIENEFSTTERAALRFMLKRPGVEVAKAA